MQAHGLRWGSRVVDLVDLGFRVDSRDLKTASGELDKLDDAGKRVEGRSTRLTTSFGGLAKAAGALGLGAIVTDSLNKFRSFESMSASLKTVTGSVEDAGDAMGVIQEFARSTPFTLDQSVQGFIKLKSLGLDPSAEALRSYGNTASAMGKDMNQMVEAVADASTSEFERLKEFGIKAKQQGEEVSFTFQGVTTTVGNNSEAIQGYLLGIGNTQFAGAMEDQMGTVNGAVSNMQDSFSGLQRTFIDQTGYAESYKQKMLSLAEVFDNASRWIVSARDSFDEFTDTLNGVGSLANAQAGPAMEGIYGIIA